MKNISKVTILAFCLGVVLNSKAQVDWKKDIDPIIIKGMEQWQVPGLAIAIVQDGKVAYANSFGYANMLKRQPVEKSTIFAIGSTSKAFTATALAHLLSERSLSWDTKVKDIWPAFQLKDWVLANQMTIPDILSHRSGLAGNDLVRYGNVISRDQLIAKMKQNTIP